MLLIFVEELRGALAVLSADPDSDECPLWALDEYGRPCKLPRKKFGERVFLASCKISVETPFDTRAVKNSHRFAKVDDCQKTLASKMRDELARALAVMVEASGSAGDFKVLVHNRSWHPSANLMTMGMELEFSAVLCGEFLEQGQGPAGPERGDLPSPKRIFSKIEDVELAARISHEMSVRDVMDV